MSGVPPDNPLAPPIPSPTSPPPENQGMDVDDPPANDDTTSVVDGDANSVIITGMGTRSPIPKVEPPIPEMADMPQTPSPIRGPTIPKGSARRGKGRGPTTPSSRPRAQSPAPSPSPSPGPSDSGDDSDSGTPSPYLSLSQSKTIDDFLDEVADNVPKLRQNLRTTHRHERYIIGHRREHRHDLCRENGRPY